MDSLRSDIEMLHMYAEKVSIAQRDLKHEIENGDDPFTMSQKQARDLAFEISDALVLFRQAQDAAKQLTSSYEALRPLIERYMNQLLVVAEMPSLPRKDFKIIPTNKLRISAKDGIADPNLRVWLVNHGLENLVEPKVNANQLTAAIKEYVAELVSKDKRDLTSDDIPDDLKELLKVSDVASIQVNKT